MSPMEVVTFLWSVLFYFILFLLCPFFVAVGIFFLEIYFYSLDVDLHINFFLFCLLQFDPPIMLCGQAVSSPVNSECAG